GKRIDAEEPEHMVDAVEMKYFLDIADAGAPPVKVAGAQHGPAIVGNAPILAPFFREAIDLEGFFRRRASAPIQIEDVGVGPDIGAEASDAVGDVTHEIDLLQSAVGFERLPLGEGQPLNVEEKEHSF